MLSVAVAGMWHLGTVTAAGLASVGHDVTGIDEDPDLIAGLALARLPVTEPGLAELTAAGLSAGRLRFSARFEEVAKADIVWVAYDTPVDELDIADVDFVHQRALRLLDNMRDGAVMVVSSQMPVGSVARLEREFASRARGRRASFACVPENLRLGKSLDIFLHPDRVVVGLRDQTARTVLEAVYRGFADHIEWMSVESAEMTKHAINSFLATSICFINEIANLCERTGADAIEVERGLKTDRRIGPHAYLHAGGAFGGGTLARDITFLQSLAGREKIRLPLIDGVCASNQQQKMWLERQMAETLHPLAGRTVAILGLTYKPGTNTLRRSPALEVARWLSRQGVQVRAFDPQIRKLPQELESTLLLGPTMESIFSGADALVVMTPCPEFQRLDLSQAPPVVFDPSRFLETLFRGAADIRYHTIGRIK